MIKPRIWTDEFNVQVLRWKRPHMLLAVLFCFGATSLFVVLAWLLSSAVLWGFAAACLLTALVQTLRYLRLLRRLRELDQ